MSGTAMNGPENLLKAEVIDRIHFFRGDDEVVKKLEAAYPFKPISEDNLYLYDNLLSHLTTQGFSEAIDFILLFFAEDEMNLDENLYESFRYVCNRSDYQDKVILPWMKSLSRLQKQHYVSLLEGLVDMERTSHLGEAVFENLLESLES